jgi:hypothetical protein
MTNLSTLFPRTTADTFYTPAMMQFDGSTGYYSKTFTSSGNKVAVVGTFNSASYGGGDAFQYVALVKGPARTRMGIFTNANTRTNPDFQDTIQVLIQNSAGTNVCRLISPVGYLDGQNHTFMASFDGDAGTATFIIDGQNADDTGNASRDGPEVTTLDAGASSIFMVGAFDTPAYYFNEKLGFVGMREAYLTNWSDFMLADGTPRKLDETTWREWGAQPLFWNPYGDMTNNLGSAGDMTKNGTIEIAYGTPAVETIPPYTPAMMKFNGSTGYYSKTGITTAGNKVSVLIRLNIPSFTGTTAIQRPFWVSGPSVAGFRILFIVYSSDYAAIPALQNKFGAYAENAAGGTAFLILSSSVVADSSNHTILFAYDGDAGTAQLIIDGVDRDDTGSPTRVLGTATLKAGAATSCFVGADAGPANFVNGQIGFCGYRDAYLTNWSDFMQADGSPKALDESTWTEWGAQPFFWNEHGDMINNLGSSGAMTKNGTIVVGKGGN